MRFVWLLAGLLATVPVAAAQEQANPHSNVAIHAGEPSAESPLSLTLVLELGMLQCQDDFEAVVDLAVRPEPGSPVGVAVESPAQATIRFDAQVFVLGYPYNYHGETTVVVEVTAQPAAEDRIVALNVSASYRGGDVAGCASTGPMPPAEAQRTLAISLAAQPSEANGTGPPSGPAPPSNPDEGGGARDAPAPSAAVAAAFLGGAANLWRRNARGCIGKKGSA